MQWRASAVPTCYVPAAVLLDEPMSEPEAGAELYAFGKGTESAANNAVMYSSSASGSGGAVLLHQEPHTLKLDGSLTVSTTPSLS